MGRGWVIGRDCECDDWVAAAANLFAVQIEAQRLRRLQALTDIAAVVQLWHAGANPLQSLHDIASIIRTVSTDLILDETASRDGDTEMDVPDN